MMILFLLKGLFRDRSRSLFPLLIVIGGVSCTVVLYSYITGIKNEMIWAHASFNAGHVKIMSKAYAEEVDQIPNDLALIGVSELLDMLKAGHPKLIWTPRIKFGGLLDIPDKNRETRSQSTVIGMAVDLISQYTPESVILNLKDALVRGRLPQQKGEIVISDVFAEKLEVQPGETATLITTTMYGSLTTYNFTIVGTIHFGISFMDRGAMIADIADIQYTLDMENAAGEILGFFPNFIYQADKADKITSDFNTQHNSEDEFSPIMFTFSDQNGRGEILEIVQYFSGIIIGIFVIIMSIVLWNAGLMGSLRRYGEIGVRLAIGEHKGRLYRSLIAESLMIGFFGSILGTALGLGFSYYLQIKGIDISSMTKNASVLIVDVLRAQVKSTSYFIGFVPGFCATLLGTTISGIGIYKRQTSQLFKELEV
jgi:putative ABC transport system permease protein